MTKSKLPVSSFGPELQNALRAGSNEKLELVFESKSLAIRFAARINALRSAMRRENHPDADRLYRAGVTFARDNPCCVVIAPKDSEFRSVLRHAGISNVPRDPSVKRFEVETPRPGVVEDPATSFLQSLTEATTIPSRSESATEVVENPAPSQNHVDRGDK